MIAFHRGRGVEPIGSVAQVACPETGPVGFVHLEVQMGQILAFGITDASHLLSAHHLFVERNEDFLEVGVHGLYNAPIRETVRDQKSLSPTRIGLSGIDHQPITNGIDRISEIRIHAPNAIEIIARVMAASLGIKAPEGLRVVGERS